MLKVNHIQKNYSHFNLNCSFDVPKGTITGIIGKNGSGKTTLFKSILNLIHLDSGSISILDTDYQNVDKNKIGCTLANCFAISASRSFLIYLFGKSTVMQPLLLPFP